MGKRKRRSHIKHGVDIKYLELAATKSTGRISATNTMTHIENNKSTWDLSVSHVMGRIWSIFTKHC